MNPERPNRTNGFRLQLSLLIAALGPACANFVAYPGAPLPDAQVATVNCYSRNYLVFSASCHVTAVDGVRPVLSQIMNTTSKLLPGHHWVEFEAAQYFGGSGGVTDVCAFDFDFEADHQYQIKAHSLEFDVGWMQKHSPALYTGSFIIEITRSAGELQTQRVRTTCSFGGGSLCRKTSDCVPHPDIICLPQEGHAFGKCGFK
ncbi:MAG: hypothetical protein Q8K18_12560 [Burkholderiales bacterium]|nr:hypothetical protein [Burkholderiales bacterium]